MEKVKMIEDLTKTALARAGIDKLGQILDYRIKGLEHIKNKNVDGYNLIVQMLKNIK